MQANSNAFVNALVQSAGGKVEFSRGSYFYNNIVIFIRSFDYIKRVANQRR